MFKRIIEAKRSIIVAADVDLTILRDRLLPAVKKIPQIGGFKIGISSLDRGIYETVREIRRTYSDECWSPIPFPIIYDHQKAANDIPDMGPVFARMLKRSGVDAAILFPFTGPATQEKWTKSCQDAGLQVIVGGIMTHKQFLVSDVIDGKGGYIADDAPERIYRMAAQMDVHHFVVPGTKIDWIKKIRTFLGEELGEENYALMSPGLITQGGDISECGQAAGDEWHAIVGSGIYGKDTINTTEQMEAAALKAVSQIAA